MRRAAMNQKNMSSCPTARITRARAKALGGAAGLPPSYRTNGKRAACGGIKPAGSLGVGPKKRAVLKDMTNVNRQSTDPNSNDAGRDETEGKAKHACIVKMQQIQDGKRENIIGHMNEKVKRNESQELVPVKNIQTTELKDQKMWGTLASVYEKTNRKDNQLCLKEEKMDESCIIDIDTRHKDPHMCCSYVDDIYQHMYAAELGRRPSLDYMENVQQDINQGMRAILVDWLVEVSDEYKMAPDTLYLTVNLIDRFLSHRYIEKQKLQLLGVSCMLIASKYEEIFAPRVEEFCFITDNTYAKDEVVKMESRVLNYLSFQLSIPTTKKFLRRFIHAAQVSHEVPSAELEFLANFLAELTLTDYNFLKFLPSLIAASAVFLARWTLDQSRHPWNPTLEHHTRYKTAELKHAVLELQELQLNTTGCPLKAIREKYKQPKLKCVSTIFPSKLVRTLF